MLRHADDQITATRRVTPQSPQKSRPPHWSNCETQETEWLKNLNASGEARIQRYGKTFAVTEPRVVTTVEAAPLVVGRWRPVFSRVPVAETLLLKTVG